MPAGILPEAMSRFTGRLISLFVHELNNHLATLRESSGLVDDILQARAVSDREKLRQLEPLVHAVEERIGHASSLVRVFGSLGSHWEGCSGSADITLAVEGLRPFFAKLARQNNLSVQSAYGRDLPPVKGSFAFLQCLLFALFENLCASLEPQTTVTISTEKAASSVIIRLTPDRVPAEAPGKPPWPETAIEAVAAAMAADIVLPHQGVAVSVRIAAAS
jgi:C4-dicarboxylate-specific signal transduction histidine kinase